jgi:DNA-binding beta-propeller fold protein YncE
MLRKILGIAFVVGLGAAVVLCVPAGRAQAPADGPYKVLKTAKVGGEGGWDYVNVDVEGRRIYIARRSMPPVINVYNLDTLEKVGELANIGAHGAVIDPKTHHGFATSKPVTMFDTRTLMPIQTIDTKGNPDGAYFDPTSERAFILSHQSPHITAINAKDGSIVKQFDIGGEPEQMAGDGKHLYVDVEDQANIAVIDAKTLDVTAHYDVTGKGATCAGLAMDAKHRILFASCRVPPTMLVMNADSGKIITTLPLNGASDGTVFNPKTMEAFSSQGDGTLTIVKENSPTDFVVEQNLKTMFGARTSALDTKTGHVIVISAEFGAAPAPAAGAKGRGGRGPILPGTFSILMVGK